MSDDKPTREESKEEVFQLSSMSHGQRTKAPIEEFWKSFERRQCELMQEAGIALSKILRGQKP